MALANPIPRKLFYKINEVAEIAGVEAYVLRYWETKFPMLKPERYGNEERRFRIKDVELILRIKGLLYDQKFTIAGAVERIKKDPSGAIVAEFEGGAIPNLPAEPAIQAATIAVVAATVENDLFASAEARAKECGCGEALVALRSIRTELRSMVEMLGSL
ncbi:hypothetical protein BH09SUM1_BH09SUM1_30860 [soil metagenome]